MRSHPYRLYGFLSLVVIGGLIALCLAAFQQAFTPHDNVRVHIFRSGQQLLPGSDVKVRGINVGTVASITSTGDGADLHLHLDPSMVDKIPTNVVARLVPKTLFGEKYVDLVLPSQPADTHLVDGSVIAQDQTKPALEIDQALNDLLPVLRAVQPGKLNETLNAVATALQGRGQELGTTVEQFDTYLHGINPHLPQLHHDVVALTGVAHTYDQAATPLLRLLSNLTVTSDTVVDEQVQIARLLGDVTAAAAATHDLLKTNAHNIVAVNTVNRRVVALLARYSPEIPCFIRGDAGLVPRIHDAVPPNPPLNHAAHVVVEFVPAFPVYHNPIDLPEFKDKRGPNCYGLPHPKLSLPVVHYKDGTQDDPRFAKQGQPGPVDSSAPGGSGSRIHRYRIDGRGWNQGRTLRFQLLARPDPRSFEQVGSGHRRSLVGADGAGQRGAAVVTTLGAGIRLAIFTAFTVLATALLGFTIANVDSSPTRSFHAIFSDATNLHAGDEVREAGVRVGTVSGVSLYHDADADVSFNLDTAVPLTSTTTLQIRYRNLIGQRYLAVVDGPAGGGALAKGATVPMSRTQPALNLTVLFNGFRPLLQGLSPGAVNQLSYNLIQVLQGEGGTVNSLLTRVGSVTGTLANHDAEIGDVIDNLNDVLGPLDTRNQQVSALIGNLQQFITGLSHDRGSIGRSLVSINRLAGTTQSLLARARPDLKADVAHLGVLAEKLDSAKSQAVLRHFLTYTPFKLQVSTPEASYGAFLNFYVCGVNFILPNGKVTTPMVNSAARCHQ